ncbi:GNAT family N-acetyltransferase [Pseudomonas sp. CGJS7]|uniref:GNAT family N-acetyltransferase n=1 Tax=Pseudomonas sp. CGJS7 TaxID=3109348 RepID=UPI0030086181
MSVAASAAHAARVRRAGPDDAPVLRELCGEHADYERSAIAAEPAEAWMGRLRAALSGDCPRLRVWLACDASEVLGYAAASLEFSVWAAREYVHLDALYLREAARGQGLGRILLAQAAAFARDSGCAQLQWQTPQWNRRAIAFYRREGARGQNKLRFTFETSTPSGF